jgi:hypothetical protein
VTSLALHRRPEKADVKLARHQGDQIGRMFF